MDLYKDLNLKPIRTEPEVWVSRLTIFRRISPDAIVMRDILLSRGLNIIWAEEAEDESTTTEITGHSAGKTTFCRMFRYVLGEKTFGTKKAMEFIRNAFPDGYVAAEIHVHGRRWAVRRPFGSGQRSYIKEDATIEELLDQHGRPVAQESYHREIGLESLLDELETGGIVQTGESIQWPHILAWCTRDQEARFQNIHEWRSPRSEAETPSFRFPKAGPLFVMRAALGLFTPDELKDEERLAELQRDKDRLTKDIEEKRREPQFRVNLYDTQLRQHLKSILPHELDIDSRSVQSEELFPDDLKRLTDKARETIAEKIKGTDQECNDLQIQIDDLGATIRKYEEDLNQLDILFGVDNGAGRELDAGLKKRDERLKIIEESKDKACPFGQVLFRECSYVQNTQRVLKITELQDAHAMKQAEAVRLERLSRIEGEKNRLRESIDHVSGLRKKTLKERDGLLSHVREQRNLLRDLELDWEALETWMQKLDKLSGFKELDSLRRKLDGVETAIADIENNLAVILRRHDDNRKLLQSIFSEIVRSVLSFQNYDGEVALDNRELSFRITHGQAMTGEAVETLAVLLADVCCMVYCTLTESAHMPGFLVHDSPREADLGIKIYRNFIRFVASLQEHFGTPGACPFQYIVTTTTPPPPELTKDPFVKLRLNAAQPQELFLRMDITKPQPADMPLFS